MQMSQENGTEDLPAEAVPNTHRTTDASDRFRPLRIWPAAICVAGIPMALALPLLVENGPSMMWMVPAFGPLLCGLAVLFWWLTFSRARWQERVLGLIGGVAALVITMVVVHPSRFQAIKGKTRGHPVVIGDRLYIRNTREAACYQLPSA
jgi:hypothetical protein